MDVTNSAIEEQDVRKVLRFATHISLTATFQPSAYASTSLSAAIAEPSVQEVDKAGLLIGSLAKGSDGSMPLWRRPGRALAMVKMLAVALRRAESEPVKRARKAFLGVAVNTLGTLTKAVASVEMCRPHADAAALALAARAIVRTGSLSCLSRLMAAAAVNTASSEPEELRLYQCGISLLQGLCTCAAYSARHTVDRGREMFTALAQSQFPEHVLRGVAFGMGPSTDCTQQSRDVVLGVAVQLRNAWRQPELQPLLAQHDLPGPSLQFVLTAMVVELLHSWDGGPRYGLSPEAEAVLRRSVLGPAGTLSLAAELMKQSTDALRCWLDLMASEQGATRAVCGRGMLSPAALYELCMRLSTCCIEAAAGQQPRGGDGGGAGASGGGEDARGDAQPEAPSQSVGGDHTADLRQPCPSPAAVVPAVDGATAAGADAAPAPPRHCSSLSEKQEKERVIHCVIALRALRGAHDVLDRRTKLLTLPAGGGVPTDSSTATPLVRPQRWWDGAARALHAAAARDPYWSWDNEAPIEAALVLVQQMLSAGSQIGQELPVRLPAAPPPDVAAALAAGALPALEHLLRRTFSTQPEGPDPDPELATLVFSWPALGWLLAYGDPRQAAAMVATQGKVLGSMLRWKTSYELQAASVDRSLAFMARAAAWVVAWRRETEDQPVAAVVAAGGSGSAKNAGRGDPGDGSRDSGGSSTGGGCGGGRADREDGPSRQLLTLTTLALATWLPRWTSNVIKYEYGLDTLQQVTEVVRLALDQLDSLRLRQPTEGDAGANRGGSGAVELDAGTGVGGCALQGGLPPSAGMSGDELLVRFSSCDGGGGGGSGSTDDGNRRGAPYCPTWALTDQQLLRLVSKLQDGPPPPTTGVAVGTSSLPPPVPPAADSPRLAPLTEASSLLRVCGYPRCCNMSGRSEADLEAGLQPYSGGGGARTRQGGEGDGGTEVWCCSRECGAVIGRVRRRVGRRSEGR
ncbi:hypothetical protein PLESTM_000068800 [Pleodorina starrii]|nr:hypothetical protein PLESTM_000068800 [Pleodorina starrii]